MCFDEIFCWFIRLLYSRNKNCKGYIPNNVKGEPFAWGFMSQFVLYPNRVIWVWPFSPWFEYGIVCVWQALASFSVGTPVGPYAPDSFLFFVWSSWDYLDVSTISLESLACVLCLKLTSINPTPSGTHDTILSVAQLAYGGKPKCTQPTLAQRHSTIALAPASARVRVSGCDIKVLGQCPCTQIWISLLFPLA